MGKLPGSYLFISLLQAALHGSRSPQKGAYVYISLTHLMCYLNILNVIFKTGLFYLRFCQLFINTFIKTSFNAVIIVIRCTH